MAELLSRVDLPGELVDGEAIAGVEHKRVPRHIRRDSVNSHVNVGRCHGIVSGGAGWCSADWVVHLSVLTDVKHKSAASGVDDWSIVGVEHGHGEDARGGQGWDSIVFDFELNRIRGLGGFMVDRLRAHNRGDQGIVDNCKEAASRV